jgi:Leucine-rich repeat (LRR) protein/predicted DNA-binding WGR domain protein
MSDVTYADAVGRSDKASIESIDASAAAELSQISSFKNLKSLRLTGNKNVTDFSFLKDLPGLEKLYLRKMGLTQIPREVESLAKLTTLFLDGNSISDFSILPKLAALSDLGLEELGLKKVPEEVLKLKGLKVLGMTQNAIGSIDCLKKLPELEEVFVSNNKLHKIPNELTALKHLRLLAIAYNYSLSSWEALAKLTGLEELVLSNSHETKALPDFIFGLANLKRLSIDIHWNAPADKLAGISSIGNLKHLEELSIHGSAITGLPAALSGLTQLKKLDLQDNKALKDLAALKDLPELQELDLTECSIEELPESFGTLTGLKRLNLSKCQLKALPESFERLKRLETLDLSHNKPLQDVSGLRNLPALERLTLYSKLRQLPATLGTLTGLRVLELSAKASDVSFLAKLSSLEELYLADCSFDRLPKELQKLKKLTTYREGKAGQDDGFLKDYAGLQELSVNQESFVLPVLPALKKLSVGQIVSKLDLLALGSIKTIEDLEIHRSDHLKELPKAIASAPSLKRIKLEFMKELSDLSPIQNLPNLESLTISYCDKVPALPQELASCANLKEIELSDMGAVEDLAVLGALPQLTRLSLASLDKLERLPDSFSNLSKLRSVKLRSVKELKDISVLKTLPALEELSAEYCDSLRSKQVGEVEGAIASRAAKGVKLKQSYREFMSSGQYKKLTGKEDTKAANYRFPWSFDTPKALRQAIEDYSWLDDHRDSDSPLGEILGNPDHNIQPLAVLDYGFEGCEDEQVDSYQEEFLLVDTLHPLNPVFVWGHDMSSLSKLHDTFDDFLANLRDFGGQDTDEEKAEGDGPKDQAKQITTLEYRDQKSAKFWRIEVEGSRHTVTYGKIGTAGASLSKDFDGADAAKKDAQKLIQSKLNKGYQKK